MMREVGWVVFDEIHYMRDKVRYYSVWLSSFLMLSRLVCLVTEQGKWRDEMIGLIVWLTKLKVSEWGSEKVMISRFNALSYPDELCYSQ